MSEICVYVELEDYLAQWFVNEQGGSVPVHLPRNSIESKILELFLTRQPADVPELGGPGKVAIAIPSFRVKPAITYNYLPKHAMMALVDCIRDRFDVALWTDLHRFGVIGRRQDELIYAWMEKHGIDIDERNWNSIAKRYQRQRTVYLDRQRKNSKKS